MPQAVIHTRPESYHERKHLRIQIAVPDTSATAAIHMHTSSGSISQVEAKTGRLRKSIALLAHAFARTLPTGRMGLVTGVQTMPRSGVRMAR